MAYGNIYRPMQAATKKAEVAGKGISQRGDIFGNAVKKAGETAGTVYKNYKQQESLLGQAQKEQENVKKLFSTLEEQSDKEELEEVGIKNADQIVPDPPDREEMSPDRFKRYTEKLQKAKNNITNTLTTKEDVNPEELESFLKENASALGPENAKEIENRLKTLKTINVMEGGKGGKQSQQQVSQPTYVDPSVTNQQQQQGVRPTPTPSARMGQTGAAQGRGGMPEGRQPGQAATGIRTTNNIQNIPQQRGRGQPQSKMEQLMEGRYSTENADEQIDEVVQLAKRGVISNPESIMDNIWNLQRAKEETKQKEVEAQIAQEKSRQEDIKQAATSQGQKVVRGGKEQETVPAGNIPEGDYRLGAKEDESSSFTGRYYTFGGSDQESDINPHAEFTNVMDQLEDLGVSEQYDNTSNSFKQTPDKPEQYRNLQQEAGTHSLARVLYSEGMGGREAYSVINRKADVPLTYQQGAGQIVDGKMNMANPQIRQKAYQVMVKDVRNGTLKLSDLYNAIRGD